MIHEIQKRYVEITGRRKEVLRGDLRVPDGDPFAPLVIVCHSFMAFKDWGFFPRLAEKIAEAGFATFAFNFARNGVGTEDGKISDFATFERNTVTSELQDLEDVIAVAKTEVDEFSLIDGSKIALLGHSRGGGIAIATAASNSNVQALVTLSAISTFQRWTGHQRALWRERGYHPLAKDSNASPLRLGVDLLNDLEHNASTLDLRKAAGHVHIPWLIVHGSADVTVPPREAEALFEASNKSGSELHWLDGVGHLYNSRNEENFETIDSVAGLVSAWLMKTL